MAVEQSLRKVMGDALGLGRRADKITLETPLLGEMPELDSMAVATLLTAIEEQFDIVIDDDEISAETFESFGSLCEFISTKQISD